MLQIVRIQWYIKST